MMYRNLYRSRIQAWTQSKTENSQRIKVSNSENYMTLKQETTKSIKVLQEVMTIMEKQD